jgi:tetratricopeptide (TPR) repeat protein
MPSEDATASDVVVHQELAKANLLKVRQEYAAAKDQCLAILRRFPNNVTANVLLGDICTETGDDEHAAEWFELALDLDPRNAAVQRKLQDVKRRASPEASALTDLGVPGPRPVLLSRALFAIALAIIAIAMTVAFTQGKNSKPNEVIRTDVVATPPARTNEPVKGDEPSRDDTPLDTPFRIQEDALLLDRLVKQTADGAALIDARFDPRTSALHITFRSDASSARALAIRIAKDSLSAESQAMVVSLRAVSDGKTVYMADITRQKAQEAGPDDQMPTNEWVPAATPQ